MGFLDLKYQIETQLIMYDDIIKRLSQEFNVGETYLKKLCKDINIKTSNSYAMVLNLVYTELSNGLNINQIIIKYNLKEQIKKEKKL